MRRNSLLVVTAVVLAGLAGSVPTNAQVASVSGGRPQVCNSPTRSMRLFAEDMGGGRIGYGLTPRKPSIPGPTLTMYEGQCLAVTLRNDTQQRVSMHAHGVSYTVASDGTPLNDGCIPPGGSKTYVFSAHPPTIRPDGTIEPGSAGYWHYHDHCMGSPHGTVGIDSGLFGAFIVRRQGDPLPDRPTFVVTMGPGMTIDLNQAPHTPMFVAKEGQRVEFEVIGEGDLFHSFHLHGHRWVNNRTGLPTGLDDASQVIDTRTIGPAESFGFQVVAGEGVGPGAWMYHCHVQNHSDMGMTGLFLVRRADGSETAQERAAVAKWRREETQHHKMMVPALLQMGLRRDGRPRTGSGAMGGMAMPGSGAAAGNPYGSSNGGYAANGTGTGSYTYNGRTYDYRAAGVDPSHGPPGKTRQQGY
jgi:manganese oxidase